MFTSEHHHDIVDPLDAIIGENIRTLRLLRDCSQKTLGAAIGVTYQQVYKYEIGKNRVSATRLVAIAAFFDVPVIRLFENVPSAAAKPDPAEIALDIQLSEICRLWTRFSAPARATLVKLARTLSADPAAMKPGGEPTAAE